MSRTTNKANYVKCPFFTSCEVKQIRCEGAIAGAANKLFFDTQERWEDHMNHHCCSDFASCPLFEVTVRKYETRDPCRDCHRQLCNPAKCREWQTEWIRKWEKTRAMFKEEP